MGIADHKQFQSPRPGAPLRRAVTVAIVGAVLAALVGSSAHHDTGLVLDQHLVEPLAPPLYEVDVAFGFGLPVVPLLCLALGAGLAACPPTAAPPTTG